MIIGNIAHKNPNYTKVRFCTSGEEEVTVLTTGLTVTVEAAECSHDWKVSSIKQPTITETGVKTCTCSKCGDTKTETIALPVKNTAVKFPYEIVLQESVAIRIRRKISQLTDTSYSGFFIKIDYDCFKSDSSYSKKSLSATVNMNDFVPYSDKESDKDIQKTFVSLQTVFDITQSIKAVAYFTDADGVVVAYNDFMSTTIKDILLGVIEKNATNDKTKTQIVDLVNYAESARLYFSDSNKTSDLAGIDAINMDFADYQSLASTQTEFTYNTTNESTAGYTKAKINTDYVIGAANDIRFRTGIYSSYDPSKFSVKFYYTDGYTGEVVSTDTLKVSDLECISSTEKVKVYKQIFSLALYDLNKTAVAALYEEGNEQPVYTCSYCLESYIYNCLDSNGSNYSSANQLTKNLLIAAMRFSASSRTAFGIN